MDEKSHNLLVNGWKKYHSSLHNLSLFRWCMQGKKEEREVMHGDENS